MRSSLTMLSRYWQHKSILVILRASDISQLIMTPRYDISVLGVCQVKTKPKPKPIFGFGLVPKTTSLKTGFSVQPVWIWFRTDLKPVCRKNQFFEPNQVFLINRNWFIYFNQFYSSRPLFYRVNKQKTYVSDYLSHIFKVTLHPFISRMFHGG